MDEVDRNILRFEQQWFRFGGRKVAAMREQFDMPPTAYYQRLNQLIDDPRAAMFDPELTNRLRRIRASRDRQRAPRAIVIGRRANGKQLT